MVKIRRAELKDVSNCLELSKTPELLNPDKTPSHKWWIEAFVKEKQIFFIAENNNKIVGFIMGERTTGNIAIFHSLIVKETYRNKGIGTKLMRSAEKECKKRKLKAIMLYGYANNKKAPSFFKKKGYIKGALTYEFIKFL